MIRVLFLCTGNSCRSQMAEGWARHLKGDVIDAFSAGVETHGLNPNTVKVMAEVGVDISGHRSKNVLELLDVPFDYVVAVCSHANEACPVLPGKVKIVHVGFDDPPALAKTATTEQEALGCYRCVRDEIRAFVETLPESLIEVTEMNDEKKNKRWWSIIRESMAKTGGCCGPGKTCCGPAEEDVKKTADDRGVKGSEATK